MLLRPGVGLRDKWLCNTFTSKSLEFCIKQNINCHRCPCYEIVAKEKLASASFVRYFICTVNLDIALFVCQSYVLTSMLSKEALVEGT